MAYSIIWQAPDTAVVESSLKLVSICSNPNPNWMSQLEAQFPLCSVLLAVTYIGSRPVVPRLMLDGAEVQHRSQKTRTVSCPFIYAKLVL